MRRGVFVTGTDTGVGKTVVSAALLQRLRPLTGARYWKPIQTGIEEDDDTATVRRLSGTSADAVLNAGVRLPRPLSPHLAAAMSGVTIELAPLIALLEHEPSGDFWVVEGAGGILVPVNEQDLMVDLMTALDLPVVVVARTALGTINHTLLTLEALKARGLWVAGAVMVGAANADNRAAIEHYGRISVIGELPWLDSLDSVTLQRAAADFAVEAVLDSMR